MFIRAEAKREIKRKPPTYWCLSQQNQREFACVVAAATAGYGDTQDWAAKSAIIEALLLIPQSRLQRSSGRRRAAKFLARSLAARSSAEQILKETYQNIDDADETQAPRETVRTLKGYALILEKRRQEMEAVDPGTSAAVRAATALSFAGHLSRATQALLRTNTMAGGTDENTISELRQLHPQSAETLPHAPPVSQPVIEIDKQRLMEIITAGCKGKAPAKSGWTEELLKCVSCNPSALANVANICKDICNGAPFTPDVWSKLRDCRLIALSKPNGRLRPIAIGEALLRICQKYLLSSVIEEIKGKFEAAGQFALTEAGCEKIVHRARELAADGATIVALDSTNAFNTLSRRLMLCAVYSCQQLETLFPLTQKLYGTASKLTAELKSGDTDISSEQGVRQGDVWGPIFFSLATLGLLREARRLFPSVHILAFMDDITLVGKDPEELTRCSDFIIAENVKLGLLLNPSKSETYGASSAAVAHSLGITNVTCGIKIVGAWIGDESSSKAFIASRLDKHRILFKRLGAMRPDVAFPLLRSCALPRWTFLCRTHEPAVMMESTVKFDDLAKEVVLKFAAIRREDVGEEHDIMFHLPLRDGGLGVTQFERILGAAYNASKNPKAPDQESRTNEINKALKEKLSPHQKLHIDANSKRNASAWLMAPTNIDRPETYGSAIITRINWPITVREQVACDGCGVVLQQKNVLAHVIGCAARKGMSVNSRHNRVRDVIAETLGEQGVPFIKEMWVTESRRIDLAIFWPEGIEFVDVTIVSSTSSTNASKSEKQIDAASEAKKSAAYSSYAKQLHATLTTARWDALGGWSSAASQLIKRISSNTGTEAETIIRKISVAIALGNGDIVASFRAHQGKENAAMAC